MTRRGEGPRPPRLAEKILAAMVGAGPRGRSILGDAREELAARGRVGSRLRVSLWYWSYVIRFAVSYRTGSGAGARSPLGLGASFRVAARGLSRRPGFSVAVVATLCLGIGATTLGFAMVDGVLLRPLPYESPGQLVDVSRVSPDWFGPDPTAKDAGAVYATPPATFFDWKERARSFQRLGAYSSASGALQTDGEPVGVSGATVTSGVFAALGASALRGRYLVPEDETSGALQVLVLSHGLWLRHFGGDPDVVGSTVGMDGVPHTVVGVMPQDFGFPRASTDFWVPMSEDSRASENRNAGYLRAVGRLAPGFGLEEARADMRRVTEEMAAVYPVEAEFRTLVFPLQDVTVAGVRSGLLLLLGAALVVLLIGCANVTNLFLARAAQRRSEFAVHAALGAGVRRLATLVLGESLLLMAVGGVLGMILARGALAPFLAALPVNIPRSGEIAIDGRVALVVLALTVGLGLLVALLPAAQVGRGDINATLRDGGRGSVGGFSLRGRGALVVAEVALAVVLLSASGVFVQSYRLSAGQDWGFGIDDTHAFYVSLPQLWDVQGDERVKFFDDFMGRLEAVPGVTGVAVASQMPLMGSYSSPPAGVETVDGIQETIIHSSVVNPSYFDVLDIPLVAGRLFDGGDVEGGAPVAVVSEALARRYWPGEDAVGQRIRIGREDDGVWHDVIGVVGSVRYRFAGAQTVEYYRAVAQYPPYGGNLVLEASPGADAVESAVASVARELLPNVPLAVASLADRSRQDRDYRWARLASILLTGMGATAVLLAILGIYGVLSYVVAQRTRDIGIRVSLGGTAWQILRTVVGDVVTPALVGVALGLVLAQATGSVVRSALVGEVPPGPWILVGVSALVLATVLAASLVPALRALRVDPLVAFTAD